MARRNAHQLGGVAPVSVAAGATLRLFAAALAAKAVVEIGTGCGVSGIWLLRGMRPDGVLTSVDVDPENQRLAREVFVHAGFASNRYRLIGGKASDVLPRLTDRAYDLVFCDADQHEYPEYLTAALRLLRPGGGLVFANALLIGAADASRTDAEAAAVREVCELVRADERLDPALIPVGSGLLAAVKRA
ncbi:MAG TPA: O-methyltransferase [Streptosporangiaceae bacterium]|nr:O-methyltransferase [Streptosporangiaceae bacterium]